MRILALLLFFFLSFVLFTSCTILILSYPRLVHSFEVRGVSAANGKWQMVNGKKIVTSKKMVITSKKVSTPTLASKPTIAPTSLPKPTLKLTQIPTPTTKPLLVATSIPTPTVSVVSAMVVETPAAPNSFMKQINDYRASNGLSAVSTNSETCSFASIRAGEIASDFSHSGFTSRINNKSLPYPFYHEVAENIAMNSDPSQIVAMWINSPGHAENMRKDTPFVCVAQSGNYFAYEGWHP